MSNFAGATLPSGSALNLEKPFTALGGSSVGLGCSTNGTIVACSYSSSSSTPPKYVRVLDATTNTELSDSGTPPLNDQAFTSAPIVLGDGGVIAADSKNIGYRPPGNSAVWQIKRKKTVEGTNDNSSPVSPVLVGTKVIFIAEKCDLPDDYVAGTAPPCGISTYKITQDTGTGLYTLSNRTAFARLSETVGSTTTWFETLNTPTVDTTSGRVYIVASELCDGCGTAEPRKGRLFVADVDKASGALSNVVVIYSFPGPSGASPVLVANTQSGSAFGNGIYFDGLAHYTDPATPNCTPSASLPVDTGPDYAGCFYLVTDISVGTTPATVSAANWSHKFIGSTFQAGAAKDPRGGVWVYPLYRPGISQPPTCGFSGAPDSGNCLVRLNASDGTTLQGPYDIGKILNGGTQPSLVTQAYMPSSALTLAGSSSAVKLIFGAMKAAAGSYGSLPQLIAVDVTSTPSLYWTTQSTVINPNTASLPAITFGQFPVVNYTAHSKVVFTGRNFGPYLFGY